MKIPGFNAESSIYRTQGSYRSIGNWGAPLTTERSVSAAQIDPECSWCRHLWGCQRLRCYCTCSGGDWFPSAGSPNRCGFCA